MASPRLLLGGAGHRILHKARSRNLPLLAALALTQSAFYLQHPTQHLVAT